MRTASASILLVVFLSLAPALALAGDRHVYVDVDGDGQLNDCPNPAHNASGVSSTIELTSCQGGSQAGRIIGTASGRVSASTCTQGGGNVQPVANGSVVDVDGDGSSEPVYAHPQACVWNMARSDSCEIHAGTYNQAGAMCDEDCGFGSLGGSLDACDRYDCFQASVVAFGDGPNLNGTGYGTAGAPAFLRGAVMNGATDSWDSDGDKEPDGSFAPVLSGDHNGNGTFEATSCTGNSCSGDSFFGVMLGCGGGGGYGSSYCTSSPPPGGTRVRLDTNGDGVFDTDAGASGTKNVDFFVIKDLVFTRYNGGNGASDGARTHEGILALEGNDDGTDGIVLDHIYMHGNDYALNPSREFAWAYVSDSHNASCRDYTEIKNSYFVQNNEKLTANECGPGNECGCPINMHDNRILLDISSDRATPGSSDRLVVIHYWKSIDRAGGGSRVKQMRFWNNEVIIKEPKSTKGYFMDLQLLGNGQGSGDGELWIYGNVFRNHPNMVRKWKRFWTSFCTSQGGGTGAWETFFFNNTLDLEVDIDQVCSDGDPGDLLVERNNAYFRTYGIHMTANVTQTLRTNELQTSISSDRNLWFDGSGVNLGTHTGLPGYAVKPTGPLDATGNCDPDGDGVAGVDYDFDGVNDTTWVDLAGNLVSCPSLSTPMHVGAWQSGSSAQGNPPAQPGLSVSDVTMFNALLSGAAFIDPDEEDSHAASQFQVDVQGGSFGSPVADSGSLAGAVTQWTSTILVPGTAHAARLRYRDSNGLWSPWSATASFTTIVDTTPPADVSNVRRTDSK